jgi:quercetin dioxygenase-like cupin family protein
MKRSSRHEEDESMSIGHKENLEKKPVTHPEAKEATMQVLISPNEGWEGYVMRIFEVAPGGFTPRHNHPWPHINYIIRGKATLHLNGEENALSPGSYAYVPAGALHQFRNTGDEPFEFICIVPEEGHA